MSLAMTQTMSEQVRSNGEVIRAARTSQRSRVETVAAAIVERLRSTNALSWSELDAMATDGDVRAIEVREALAWLRESGAIRVSTVGGISTSEPE